MNDIIRKRRDTLMLTGLIAVSSLLGGCLIVPDGDDYDDYEGAPSSESADGSDDGAQSPDPGLDVSISVAETQSEPWTQPQLGLAVTIASQATSLELSVAVDGVEWQTASLTYERTPSYELDTVPLAAGEHTITVSVMDPEGHYAEATDTMILGESLVAIAAQVPSTDDGLFGGGIEPELHMYDADSGAWLGCTTGTPWDGVPFAFRNQDGLLLRDDVAGLNLVVHITEDDGYPCPAPASIGNPYPINDDDDLLATGTPVSAAAIDGGVSSGSVALAWGRGW